MNRHVPKNIGTHRSILDRQVPGEYRYRQAPCDCSRNLCLLLGVALPFDSAGVADGDILPLNVGLPPQ